MLRTINPAAASKTAEIMSRYRPIAPKPVESSPENDNSSLPDGIRKSPYLRNVWANLQARPTRTRKRGRSAAFSPPPVKRRAASYAAATMHGLPIMSESVVVPPAPISIDLNLTAVNTPEELDFLPQLLPPTLPAPVIISPKPIRPVGSTITVGKITVVDLGQGEEKIEDAEAVLEGEMGPAVISDSRNKVRMTNWAYKEMVGQPECGWLDCAGGGSRRIGGEVVVKFREMEVEMGMHGFDCEVRIEWEVEGKKRGVNARCSGRKLGCEGKDYQYLWRMYGGEDGGAVKMVVG